MSEAIADTARRNVRNPLGCRQRVSLRSPKSIRRRRRDIHALRLDRGEQCDTGISTSPMMKVGTCAAS